MCYVTIYALRDLREDNDLTQTVKSAQLIYGHRSAHIQHIMKAAKALLCRWTQYAQSC